MKGGTKVSVCVEGHIMMDLLMRWGMVAAVPDGEDSSGRQRMRLQTPQELVERAHETAKIAARTMILEGWMQSVRSPELESGEYPQEESPDK